MHRDLMDQGHEFGRHRKARLMGENRRTRARSGMPSDCLTRANSLQSPPGCGRGWVKDPLLVRKPRSLGGPRRGCREFPKQVA